ncbi:Kelch repeat-containing protein [Daejeonella oryzae]|uniref:Kelch repeat-containing protein n=1 Tax=Daejeonella oryzae TaxID=1122943 RepID=UPI000428708F|nr:hypothetical protein [Daejeonella oryzae]
MKTHKLSTTIFLTILITVCLSLGACEKEITNIPDGTSFIPDASQLDNGPNSWTRKADFGGTGRDDAAGFSIGNKGYIGTGAGTGSDRNFGFLEDFWEYDTDTKAWSQKADFGGGLRANAIGFSIGNKGYIVTGVGLNSDSTDSEYKTDFWEFDPGANIWTRKADFGQTGRGQAVGFRIGNKGYVGTGYSDPVQLKDFWEYDPGSNTWTRKADFGGGFRSGAVGFNILNKGYIGTGGTNDFWEYDPVTDKWTMKAAFMGEARQAAIGFGIGAKGYIGGGLNSFATPSDFWEYNPVSDIWKQKADVPDDGGYRASAVSFSIGNHGFVGTGANFPDGKKDFWQYTPSDTIPVYHGIKQEFQYNVDNKVINDFTEHTYNVNSTKIGFLAEAKIKRFFKGKIKSIKVILVSGHADDEGFVGKRKVTVPVNPNNTGCFDGGDVREEIDVTDQVKITDSGQNAVLYLCAKETCQFNGVTGWGSDNGPHPNARFQWIVELE